MIVQRIFASERSRGNTVTVRLVQDFHFMLNENTPIEREKSE